MKMFKRIIAMLSAAVIAMTVLGSCQNRQPVTLVKKENPDSTERQKGIVIWGSSLGYSVTTDNFAKRLMDDMMSNECYIPVENLAVPKESTKTILARAGLIKIVNKNNFKLESQIGDAQIEFEAEDKSNIFPLRYGTDCDGGMTDVTIAGIEGTLSIARDTAQLDRPKYYFKRKTEGKEVTIKKGEQITSKTMDSFKDYIPIITMGEYGDWGNVTDLIKQQQLLLSRSEDKDKFVILGMVTVPVKENSNFTEEENEEHQRKYTEKVDEVMTKKWGDHYINVREALCSRETILKAKEMGVEFDKYDVENIKKKVVPDALKYDKESLNTNAYDILGDIVYDKLVELGYLYHKEPFDLLKEEGDSN